MPERPKRRKNNKNKRKNKNNNWQSNKNVVNNESEQCSASNNNLDTTSNDEKCEQSVENSSNISVTAEEAINNKEKGCTTSETQSRSTLTDDSSNEENNKVNPVNFSKSQQPQCDELKKETEIQEESTVLEEYVVESPKSSFRCTKNKLHIATKSKSLDDDNGTKIEELSDITEDQTENTSNLPLVESSSVVISDIESDVEWETANSLKDKTCDALELAKGTESLTAQPLTIALCDENRTLSTEQESSLRNYLGSLNLSTRPPCSAVEITSEIEEIINREVRCKLRKKGLPDDFFQPRSLGPPRYLDVIDEEGSSESSCASRRHSSLNEKKNDDEEPAALLEKKVKTDDNTKRIADSKANKNSFGKRIPQECVLVDAKIKDPNLSEARGDWSVQTIEKMSGAELVYLTDSSSSTSSIHELLEETDEGSETDVSIRMITPTIEVIDTERLLTKSFLQPKQDANESITRQNEIKLCINGTNYADMHTHEIVVVSPDDIKTSLYVKDVEDNQNSSDIVKRDIDKHTDDMKILKSELQDAFSNLIKEVSSDTESTNENPKGSFSRQDSVSSSVCSSQCTARYNPSHSSLNDVSNILHDDTHENNQYKHTFTAPSDSSHVKDVFERVSESASIQSKRYNIQPLHLRDICVKRISNLPYGDKILEELASVSQKLQDINLIGSDTNNRYNDNHVNIDNRSRKSSLDKMPYYPLPDVSSIEKVVLPAKAQDSTPPPVQPRNSSLKKTHEETHSQWTGLPTNNEPVYVCLSPSQKMLMEKTNTVITKEDASDLLDIHSKFVNRRGYGDSTRFRQDDPPAVPFKSKTGSRLLAIIRDPAVTSNINSYVSNRNQANIQNSRDQSYCRNEPFYMKSNSARDLSNISNTFKPIPPPRPRKYSSTFYESDESSEFTDSSLRSVKSEKKYFHYSTGALNTEIENDISSIQNMHRRSNNFRDFLSPEVGPRRPSLPKDLCEKQMEYIRQKEKEVEAEIQRLEQKKLVINPPERRGPRAPLISEKEIIEENNKFSNSFFSSHKKNFAFNSMSNLHEKVKETDKPKMSSAFSSSQEEILRDKMYSEYVTQMAERQERKQHKVIKITNKPASAPKTISKSMSSIDVLDSKVNNPMEKEFICKARERWTKLGFKDPETEDEKDDKDVYREPKVVEHKIKVIEGGEVRDVQKLPSHLQEFVKLTAKEKDKGTSSPAVWRPGAPSPTPPAPVARSPGAPPPPPPPPPVWTPGASPVSSRKAFRPVHFEESPPVRRKFENSAQENGCSSGSESESRLRTSQSAPAAGLNCLGTPLSPGGSRLPRAQNPTVTLLQKAREGQLARGSSYLQQEKDDARLPRDRASPPKGAPVHALRREYASEGEAERSYDRPRQKMADEPPKLGGIGPTTKDGMPVALRSEVQDQSRWYKKMYDTIHKNKYDDNYVTIRYKSPRGQPPPRSSSNRSQYAYFDPRSGYLSEPEGGLSRVGSSWSDAYDSDVTTGPRRRTASVQDDRRNDNDVSSPYLPSNKYSTLASARASQEVYKNQPGRIENYVPGKSSVVDKEAKQWWDEVMDIFDGQLSNSTSQPPPPPKEKKDLTSTILSKSNMARALKESGYESDSTLVFRRREDTDGPLSPAERRAAYKDLQAGGEPPLRGFRSPAPPRTESPRRYVESDVNIHYRCPVRRDPLPLVPERELARQQAEHMKRLYREQKRTKYLQELQDMQNRRHQDNFTPSQKIIVPTDRYEDVQSKMVAKALYNFSAKTSKELSFRKGDIITIRKAIDANWYEGELHGRIGLFPYNYVELLKGDAPSQPRTEGKARAKFDFIAQTNLELPLKKGEEVTLTRRVDHNWWEGRLHNKTGIFPDSYITVLQEPSQNKIQIQQRPINNSDKPVASPASHGLLEPAARRSMGAHSYTPQLNSPNLANAPPSTQPLPGYTARPAQASLTPSDRGYGPPKTPGVDLNNTEPLYVDTNAEAVPYRAMYKYRPQNPDELELNEGDTVYVLEKCDDGWYVGSSQRSGRFGTFPGNYVERI